MLETDDAVDAWLSPSTTLGGALKLIVATDSMQWHPVSRQIGKISAEGADLVAEVSLAPTPKKPSKSAAMMVNWLKGLPKAAAATTPEQARATSTSTPTPTPAPIPTPTARSPGAAPAVPTTEPAMSAKPDAQKRSAPQGDGKGDSHSAKRIHIASGGVGGGSGGGSGSGGSGGWSCGACTFLNDNPMGLACALCGTHRDRE